MDESNKLLGSCLDRRLMAVLKLGRVSLKTNTSPGSLDYTRQGSSDERMIIQDWVLPANTDVYISQESKVPNGHKSLKKPFLGAIVKQYFSEYCS